eukprot:c3208_g1_i1.p1 GENE.c3208_g1_i1~~c3208_g1_i1.p1  ORF type:complete len:178 (+),score=31.23 c3208_g1_i1:30-563(+)
MSVVLLVVLGCSARPHELALKGNLNSTDNSGGCPCSSDFTCCWMSATKEWGCCPVSGGTCCKDGLYCCPPQYPVCSASTDCSRSVSAETTHKLGLVIPATPIEKEPAQQPEQEQLQTKGSQTCPDKSECGEEETCCPLQHGKYGCCVMEDAVCCHDLIHCCPSSYPVCSPLGVCSKY